MLLVFLGGGSQLACFSSVLSRIERLRKKNFHRSILGTNMNFPLFPHSLSRRCVGVINILNLPVFLCIFYGFQVSDMGMVYKLGFLRDNPKSTNSRDGGTGGGKGVERPQYAKAGS